MKKVMLVGIALLIVLAAVSPASADYGSVEVPGFWAKWMISESYSPSRSGHAPLWADLENFRVDDVVFNLESESMETFVGSIVVTLNRGAPVEGTCEEMQFLPGLSVLFRAVQVPAKAEGGGRMTRFFGVMIFSSFTPSLMLDASHFSITQVGPNSWQLLFRVCGRW